MRLKGATSIVIPTKYKSKSWPKESKMKKQQRTKIANLLTSSRNNKIKSPTYKASAEIPTSPQMDSNKATKEVYKWPINSPTKTYNLNNISKILEMNFSTSEQSSKLFKEQRI